MPSRLAKFITDARFLQALALAALVAWPIAFAVHLGRLDRLHQPDGKPVGGDFISVYTGGTLLLEGQGGELYDLALQQRTQGRVVHRDDYRALCSFVSPPVVALAAAPLAKLPFLWAYAAYTLLMALSLALALWLLRPQLALLREHGLVVLGLSLCFFPLAVTITGGQNTALTVLLLAAAYAALRRGNDVAAGVALGLLFYKPQFAMVPCLLLLARAPLARTGGYWHGRLCVLRDRGRGVWRRLAVEDARNTGGLLADRAPVQRRTVRLTGWVL